MSERRLADLSVERLRVISSKLSGSSLSLTDAGFQAAGLGAEWPAFVPLASLPPEAVLHVVQSLIDAKVGVQRPKIDVVWTGPEGSGGTARDTWVVLAQLLADARKSVLIAGYSFDHGNELFRTLHRNMRDHGVTCDMFINVPRPEAGETSEAQLRKSVREFVSKNWDFGAPHPTLYYDPRTIEAGSVASLHAKCVVVDDEVTLVGSANFTDRGQTRNIEMGVLIRDSSLAREVAGQWRGLVSGGVVRRCEI